MTPDPVITHMVAAPLAMLLPCAEAAAPIALVIDPTRALGVALAAGACALYGLYAMLNQLLANQRRLMRLRSLA